MSKAASIMVIVVAAACGAPDPLRGSSVMDGGGVPDDAGVDGRGGSPDDATVDAGSIDAAEPDAGTVDLATICGGQAPASLDDWEDCYEKRKCEWEVGCVALNSYRDVQDCIASGDAVSGGELAAARRDRKRAVDQGRASINVDAFTQCLIRTSAASCNTALFDEACLTRFTGTIADGAGCYADVDCASPDAVCQSDCADACCVGTCHPKFKEGEPCDLFASCEPGLRCDGYCLTGDINSTCDNALDCDFDAWCDDTAHRCRPTFAPGAACTGILQCGGDTTCIGLSVTSSAPGHCLRNSQPGDPCDDLCHGNLYCDGSGTCQALPLIGESCSPIIPCAGANAICSGGVCVMRSDIGVACGSQTCLPGLFCTSELNDPNPVCAPRRAEGEPCAAPNHCDSYLCSGVAAQPGVCLPWSSTCP